MAKLDDFENNSQVREYKTVPSGVYSFKFDKATASDTASGFKRYSLQLQVQNEGEYEKQCIFPSLLSGWKTAKGEGNHLGQLRALLRVIVSQNLDHLKLRKFYDKIFKEDLEIEDFFENILESNILNDMIFEAKVVMSPGNDYKDKDGVTKKGNPQYNLDLSATVETEALEKINASNKK